MKYFELKIKISPPKIQKCGFQKVCFGCLCCEKKKKGYKDTPNGMFRSVIELVFGKTENQT